MLTETCRSNNINTVIKLAVWNISVLNLTRESLTSVCDSIQRSLVEQFVIIHLLCLSGVHPTAAEVAVLMSF